MTKSKFYSNFAIPDSLNMSKKLRFEICWHGLGGWHASKNFDISNRSFQRCKFNGICHQDSLPTNASFISIQSKKPLIPCHLHHSTQPTPSHPRIQTMIHHWMMPLVMKKMMKCWWNKINKNHQQQNCCPTMRRIISTLPWVGRTYEFFLPWPLAAPPMIFQTTRMHHFRRQRPTILK